MSSKFFCMIIFLMALTMNSLTAQSVAIPKIGVVDVNRIYRETNKNSTAMKQIDETKNRVNSEVKKRQDDISLLEEQLLDAGNREDLRAVTDLTRQVNLKKAELERYWNTADSQLKRMADSVKVDPAFMELIHKAIIDVSDRNGYSVVLASNTNILYWSKKVDLTSDVIAYINGRLS